MQGAQCNQAIMLVTDGAPLNYEKIFEKYNWPHKPVRIFTYVIGREIIDTAATNWMACANKGNPIFKLAYNELYLAHIKVFF